MIHTIQELKQKQSMPLKAKIIMTENRIRGWYNHFNGNVYIYHFQVEKIQQFY